MMAITTTNSVSVKPADGLHGVCVVFMGGSPLYGVKCPSFCFHRVVSDEFPDAPACGIPVITQAILATVSICRNAPCVVREHEDLTCQNDRMAETA
ncbi:MAG: hypothetical protein ACREPQ_09405 [Rhodanobacter sp.]